MTRASEHPLLQVFVALYEKERPKIKPLYPADKKTGRMELPEDIIADLKFLLQIGNKPAAVKRVAEPIGARLRFL